MYLHMLARVMARDIKRLVWLTAKAAELESVREIRNGYSDVLTRRLSMRVLKCNKGTWWMPWQQEAMKDVAPCEKARGDGSIL